MADTPGTDLAAMATTVLLGMSLAMTTANPTPRDEAPPAAWPHWGGPNQDFRASAQGLAAGWPEDGPAKLWSRKLGEGYSAIAADAGRLYTMYRAENKEVVICLDAGTGETIWEHRYEHPPHERHQHGYGDGPRSTPLVAGDRLFTIGVAGKMLALDKNVGKVLWSHELWHGDLGGNILSHGYSSSPVAYGGSVIVPVGGDAAGLVAFDQKTGRIRWKTGGFRNSFSSPRLLDVAGERQLVVFMAEEVIGVDPDSGELRWSHPHANQWQHNISMPVMADTHTMFISSPQAGARGLRLVRDGDEIDVEEIWSSRRIQFYHVSSVQEGDWVYGSSGMMAPAFMTAVNIRTGEVGWRERGFAKANCVAADGKLVILDEDGMLYLASATPEKLLVHAGTQLLDGVAWTVPTIVGSVLYVRDNRQILAVDLGDGEGSEREATVPAVDDRRRQLAQ